MLDLRYGLLVGRRTALFVGLVVAMTSAAAARAVLTPEEWVGWLPTTVGALESGAAFTPSVVCVAAAWLIGQPRAHRMTEWVSTSPRSHEQRAGAAVAFVAAALSVSLLTLALIIGGISLHFGLLDGWSRPRTLLLVPGFVAYLFFWLAAGAVLGDKLRREVALPIAAVAPYAAYAMFAIYSDGPVAALGVGDGRNYSYVEPAVDMMAVRAAFWASMAIATWAWVLGHKRLSTVFRWVASLWGAAAILVGVVIVPIPQATVPTCAGAAPRACLESSFASALPRYRAAIDSLWDEVPAPLRADVVVSVPGIGPTGESTLVAPPVAGFTEPARVVDETMFAARVGDELFLAPCISGGGGRTTALVLVLWWRNSMGVPLDGTAFAGDGDFRSVDPDFEEHMAAAEAFAALRATERLTWFEENAVAIRSCSGADLPA